MYNEGAEWPPCRAYSSRVGNPKVHPRTSRTTANIKSVLIESPWADAQIRRCNATDKTSRRVYARIKEEEEEDDDDDNKVIEGGDERKARSARVSTWANAEDILSWSPSLPYTPTRDARERRDVATRRVGERREVDVRAWWLLRSCENKEERRCKESLFLAAPVALVPSGDEIIEGEEEEEDDDDDDDAGTLFPSLLPPSCTPFLLSCPSLGPFPSSTLDLVTEVLFSVLPCLLSPLSASLPLFLFFPLSTSSSFLSFPSSSSSSSSSWLSSGLLFPQSWRIPPNFSACASISVVWSRCINSSSRRKRSCKYSVDNQTTKCIVSWKKKGEKFV